MCCKSMALLHYISACLLHMQGTCLHVPPARQLRSALLHTAPQQAALRMQVHSRTCCAGTHAAQTSALMQV